MRRRAAGRLTVAPDMWALLAIVVTVLIANLPYLLGLFDPNPLDLRGGLSSAIRPGLLAGKPVIDPAYGVVSQALGHLATLDVLHLRLPWWNPYEGTGMPLVGETQAAALFPPTLLTGLVSGQLYERVLLEASAGIGTYLLSRRIRVGRPAAIAGAIAYALNGKFAWFADATVNPLPFLPLVLLGIEQAYAAARTGRAGGWRLIALAGALSVYAGYPEVAYPDTLMAACWLGWRCGCLQRRRLRPFLTKAALGAVGGVLLAAPMLLAMDESLRHVALGIHAGTRLGRTHLGAAAMPQLLLPYVYGQVNADPHATTWIMVGGYLPTTLLALAVLGFFTAGRRGLKLVLLSWVLLVFARMYGRPPLLGHVIGALPDVSRIRFYRYATATLELAVILLAALGLDELTRAPVPRRRWLMSGLAALAAAVAAALCARHIVHSRGAELHPGAYFSAAVAWGALIVAAVTAVALVGGERLRAALLVLVVAVDVVVLFAVPEFSAPRATTVDLAPVAYLRKHLGEGRFFTLGPIAPNYGSYFGLASFALSDFPPNDFARYVRARADPAVSFAGFRARNKPSRQWELMHHLAGYQLAGVRYVLTAARDPLRENTSLLRRVFRSPTTDIYRVTGASPYFQAPGCRVRSRQRDSAIVACRQKATLIRRETWFTGWQAQLDGHATSMRASGLFQAVTVPAGYHRVTFSYAPPDMGWAGVGLLGGCVMLLGPAIRRLARASLPRRPCVSQVIWRVRVLVSEQIHSSAMRVGDAVDLVADVADVAAGGGHAHEVAGVGAAEGQAYRRSPSPSALEVDACDDRRVAFIPGDFQPPHGLVTDHFLLEPLRPEHNEADHEAWSSSIEHIRATPGFSGGRWPRVMSLEENRADLERHARDFAARSGFTYTVLDPSDRRVIGCVYIYPDNDRVHDAVVTSWVRASRAGCDAALRKLVARWLVEAWPFERISYPGPA